MIQDKQEIRGVQGFVICLGQTQKMKGLSIVTALNASISPRLERLRRECAGVGNDTSRENIFDKHCRTQICEPSSFCARFDQGVVGDTYWLLTCHILAGQNCSDT